MEDKKLAALKKKRRVFHPNAPRFGKGGFTDLILSRELYKKWMKDNPEYGHIEYNDFLQIWRAIANTIYSEIGSNPDGVRLPFYTGEIAVKFVKNYYPAIDQKATTELEGQPVEHLNWNSNRKLGKIVWTIEFARKYNKSIRNFGFSAPENRTNDIHKILKETPEIFKDNARSGRYAYEDKINKARNAN